MLVIFNAINIKDNIVDKFELNDTANISIVFNLVLFLALAIVISIYMVNEACFERTIKPGTELISLDNVNMSKANRDLMSRSLKGVVISFSSTKTDEDGTRLSRRLDIDSVTRSQISIRPAARWR